MLAKWARQSQIATFYVLTDAPDSEWQAMLRQLNCANMYPVSRSRDAINRGIANQLGVQRPVNPPDSHFCTNMCVYFLAVFVFVGGVPYAHVYASNP